jgi:hypothetical protein
MNRIHVDPTRLKNVIPQFIDNPYTQLGINYGLGAGIGAIGQAGYNAVTGTNNANPLITGLQMAPLLGGRGLSRVINTPQLDTLRANNQYIQMLEDGSTASLAAGTLANAGNALFGGKDIDTNMVGSTGYYGQALPLARNLWANAFPVTANLGGAA